LASTACNPAGAHATSKQREGVRHIGQQDGMCSMVHDMYMLDMQPKDSPGRPKLLVCHDYKGGFVEGSWPKVRCTELPK
jgi:hypothetical protein